MCTPIAHGPKMAAWQAGELINLSVLRPFLQEDVGSWLHAVAGCALLLCSDSPMRRAVSLDRPLSVANRPSDFLMDSDTSSR